MPRSNQCQLQSECHAQRPQLMHVLLQWMHGLNRCKLRCGCNHHRHMQLLRVRLRRPSGRQLRLQRPDQRGMHLHNSWLHGFDCPKLSHGRRRRRWQLPASRSRMHVAEQCVVQLGRQFGRRLMFAATNPGLHAIERDELRVGRERGRWQLPVPCAWMHDTRRVQLRLSCNARRWKLLRALAAALATASTPSTALRAHAEPASAANSTSTSSPARGPAIRATAGSAAAAAVAAFPTSTRSTSTYTLRLGLRA